MPLVNKDTRFALKGGTAISFFIRHLPRLSVDIDLTYLPIESREITLKSIDEALHELAGQIKSYIPEVKIVPKHLKEHNLWSAMQVHTTQARIKIEPNFSGYFTFIYIRVHGHDIYSNHTGRTESCQGTISH